MMWVSGLIVQVGMNSIVKTPAGNRTILRNASTRKST